MSSDHQHKHESGCGCHHEKTRGGWWSLALCAGVFISGIVVTAVSSLPPFAQALWMAVAVVPLLPSLLHEAWEELCEKAVGENTLLFVALVASFAIGECVEGAMVLLLFVLGERIEHKAVNYSRHAISSLAAMTPDSALRIGADSTVSEIPATQVTVGDILRIPPHSRVPVDCRVLSGQSEIDASALTGESMPVYCTVDSELLSGCVNGAGELTVCATRITTESAAARIMHLVEDAAAKKGRSERFITRFARLYTPAVMFGALVVAIVPPLCGGAWNVWIYRALAFLVASCPCALVISVPLGFYAGIAAAARQGVLIKGGSFVETLARVRAMAFDKTGTLTTDMLALEKVIPVESVSSEGALRIAAALESHASHPVAKAICAAAEDVLPPVTNLQEVAGLGVTATVDGHIYACGGARLMRRLGASVSAFPDAAAYLYCDGEVLAAFIMTTTLQEGAVESIKALHARGVSRLVILSGDRQAAAQAVADAVGIDEVHGDLLPEDKLTALRTMQETGTATAFIGDGINDAPVLAAADVGIAMGLGSAAAIEMADAVLIAGGLTRLPRAVDISRRTVRTVRANIAFALGVKAIALLLAVFGVAPMWLAVFADTGVTVLCVLNALRLLL